MVRRSKAQWRELIGEHALSGMSAAEFCRDKSINPKYFSTRKRRFELESKSFLKVVPPEIERPPEAKSVRVRVIEFEASSDSMNDFLSSLSR